MVAVESSSAIPLPPLLGPGRTLLIYGKEATFTLDARAAGSILIVVFEYLAVAADDRRFPRPGALFNEQSRDFENARFYLKRKRGPYFEAIVLFKSKPRENGAARRTIKERRCRLFCGSSLCITCLVYVPRTYIRCLLAPAKSIQRLWCA